MKKRMFGIISLAAILGAYLIFRYPLFYLHGMKELPLTLCIIGVVIIGETGLIKSNKVLPVSTALGYIVGFFAGVLFGFDYGIGLNSKWIIWVCCFVAAIIIGGVASPLMTKKAKK